MGHLSVVISDLDIKGIRTLPTEDDAPLVVNADRVETRQLIFERMAFVTGWDFEILQNGGGIDHIQLSQGNRQDGGRKVPTWK